MLALKSDPGEPQKSQTSQAGHSLAAAHHLAGGVLAHDQVLRRRGVEQLDVGGGQHLRDLQGRLRALDDDGNGQADGAGLQQAAAVVAVSSPVPWC